METDGWRRGTLGFSVLRFWLFFRSVFRFLCQKTSVFRFWCSLRFADFSFFSIWFSVFIENMSGFSVLLSDVLFRFSYFVLFGFRFLLDLSGN